MYKLRSWLLKKEKNLFKLQTEYLQNALLVPAKTCRCGNPISHRGYRSTNTKINIPICNQCSRQLVQLIATILIMSVRIHVLDLLYNQSFPVSSHPSPVTLGLNSSPFRLGRNVSILSQVNFHSFDSTPSTVWKIPAVSITKSMFFKDSGMASHWENKVEDVRGRKQQV